MISRIRQWLSDGRLQLIGLILWLALTLFLMYTVYLLVTDRLTSPVLVFAPYPALATDSAGLVLQNASRDAENAVSSINQMLGLIQVIGLVFGLIAGAATLLGVWNSARLQEQLDLVKSTLGSIVQTRDQVNETRDQVNALNQQGVDQLRQMDDFKLSLPEMQRNFELKYQATVKASSLIPYALDQIALGNMSEAAETLEDACDLDRDNVVAQYFLGDVYLRLDRVNQGYEKLKSIYREDILPAARASYAYALRLKGDACQSSTPDISETYYAEARLIFTKLWETRKDLKDVSGESVYGAMAGLCRRRDSTGEAIEWYERCRQQTPERTYPLNNLALLKLQSGKHHQREEALDHFAAIKRLAERRLRLTPYDYWLWFDYLTARIALAEDRTRLEMDIMETFILTDNLTSPLAKFRLGLDELKDAIPALANIEHYLSLVDQELNRRKPVSSTDAISSTASPA